MRDNYELYCTGSRWVLPSYRLVFDLLDRVERAVTLTLCTSTMFDWSYLLFLAFQNKSSNSCIAFDNSSDYWQHRRKRTIWKNAIKEDKSAVFFFNSLKEGPHISLSTFFFIAGYFLLVLLILNLWIYLLLLVFISKNQTKWRYFDRIYGQSFLQ